jgi:iron complex transport system ATP-binding protein
VNGIIEAKNLSFGYSPQAEILGNISFDVQSGAFLSIAGPNGAGKTTLLNLLCGLLTPTSGSVHIDARAVDSYSARKLAQRIAVVRQEYIPVFDFTVAEVVSMARTPYMAPFGFESRTDRDAVDEALAATDTARFAQRPIANLSGGERQRVFVARALAQNTPIMLLDEPTSFLDLKHQVKIYDLLKEAQLEKGKTIVAVTHDINLAAQYCDQIFLLRASQPTAQNTAGGPPSDNYYMGKTSEILSAELIEEVFGVKVFSGRMGQERFFLPRGKFSKDKTQKNR